MLSLSGRMTFKRSVLVVALVLTGLFVALFSLQVALSPTSIPQIKKSQVQAPSSKSKNAFVTFLATREEEKRDEEDVYFIGIRMLIYQLLHDPETRTNTSIPFVVMVTKDVEQEKRDRLSRDGAQVIEVDPIQVHWIKPGRSRWEHVLDKLHVFELVQFDKILLLDSDIVVARRLDGVFEDEATRPSRNLGKPDQVKDDEPPQPSSYIMAGNSGPSNIDHSYPAPRGSRINAGFVIFQPSIEMFNFYMAMTELEGRFPGGSPEQDLWNYVHRWDGNMPWKQVNPDWTVNTPIYQDFENGIASFHEKYWGCARDRRLRDVLLRSRWKMEGYWSSEQQILR